MTDDFVGGGLKYWWFVLPALALFFYGRLGFTRMDNSVVLCFVGYALITLMYVMDNEGLARTDQVVGDNFHFPNARGSPVMIGDYCVFWNGIDWWYSRSLKDRVLVTHKSSAINVGGNNWSVNALAYTKRFFELPFDAQKVFRTHGLRIDHILYATVSRVDLASRPDFLWYEDELAKYRDIASSSQEYAQAKVGDFEKLAHALGRITGVGAKKSLVRSLYEKLNKPSDKDDR